mgnify:CR=1 FL=1|tara:strand:+ start:309 stop:560 length:252 start_codon:yes stop_codon:yes gene_type:complete
MNEEEMFAAILKYANEQIRIAEKQEKAMSGLKSGEESFDIETKEEIDFYLLNVGIQEGGKKMAQLNGEYFKEKINVARQNHAR